MVPLSSSTVGGSVYQGHESHSRQKRIEDSGSLDILCRHWALPELKQVLDEHYPRLVELPSWIKTVHESAYGSQTEGFGGRRTGDSFVGVPEARCYNASHGLPPIISFGRDNALPKQLDQPSAENTGEEHDKTDSIAPSRQRLVAGRKVLRARRITSDMNLTITIRGLCIGVVSDTHPMYEGIIPRQVLRRLGHDPRTELQGVADTVWRTLVADRDADGKAPPAWYHRASATNLKADYLKRVQAVCWHRKYIECEAAPEDKNNRKLVGIAPQDSKVDDVVCILYGCSVPCVLRPFWSERGRGEQPSYYELLTSSHRNSLLYTNYIFTNSTSSLSQARVMFLSNRAPEKALPRFQTNTPLDSTFDKDIRDTHLIYDYDAEDAEGNPEKWRYEMWFFSEDRVVYAIHGGPMNGRINYQTATYQCIRPGELWQVNWLEETGTVCSLVYDIPKQKISTLISFSRGHWENPQAAHGDKRNPGDFARWRVLSRFGNQTDRFMLSEQADIVENFKGRGDLVPIEEHAKTF
ncbi:hypothetical protein CCUS01_08518 [Colletotrichum cuscutae]|nr:hypothetical protein CCUS01_08518 [Colletotrichum cuscutae]